MQRNQPIKTTLASSNVPILEKENGPIEVVAFPEEAAETELAPNTELRIPKSPPLRGVTLFAVVFAELSAQLGEEFSTSELMRAAQQLIDFSKSEYISKTYKDVAERSGYYSWDLVRAFRLHAWQIAGEETDVISHCDADELSLETVASARMIQNGWNDRMWEF